MLTPKIIWYNIIIINKLLIYQILDLHIYYLGDKQFIGLRLNVFIN